MGLIRRALCALTSWFCGRPRESPTARPKSKSGHANGSNGKGDVAPVNGANVCDPKSLSIADACKMKQWSKVPEIVEQEGVDINCFDSTGKGNALHWAAWYGQVETVRLLIEKGADMHIFSKMGAFPIHLAVRSGQVAVMHELWCRDPSLICRKDSHGRTPMHHAALEGSPATVEWLYLHGASVNVVDTIGATPLHWAAHDGRMLASQLLFNYNVNNTERDKANSRTPLHLLALKQRWSLLEAALNLRPEAFGGPEVFDVRDNQENRPVELVKWNFAFRSQMRAFACWLRCRRRYSRRSGCAKWCLSLRPRILNLSLVAPFYHIVHDVAYLGIILPLLLMYGVLDRYLVGTMAVGAFFQAAAIYYWALACTSDPGYCEATDRLESHSIGPDSQEKIITDVLGELNDKSLERYGPPIKKKSKTDKDDKTEEQEEPQRPCLEPEKIQELDEAIAEIKARLSQKLKEAAVARREPYGVEYKELLCASEPVSNVKDWGRQACTVCGRMRTQRSKHCKDCGRCVSRFDHHCPWIGNCVGSRNVMYFTKFVGFTALALMISEVLALQIQYIFSYHFPAICLLLLLMCTIDGFCILFTLVLFGRQVLLASQDLTEYESTVLHLGRLGRPSCCQSMRNMCKFFCSHRHFVTGSARYNSLYPETPLRMLKNGDRIYRRYKGTISHPALEGGAIAFCVIMKTPYQGEWTIGDHKPSPIKIEHNGKKVRIKEKTIELDGDTDESGVVKGTVLHAGVAGGEFELVPEAKDEKNGSGKVLREASLESFPVESGSSRCSRNRCRRRKGD